MTQTKKKNRECPLKSSPGQSYKLHYRAGIYNWYRAFSLQDNTREELDILETSSKHTVTVSFFWMLSGPVSWHHYLSLSIKS